MNHFLHTLANQIAVKNIRYFIYVTLCAAVFLAPLAHATAEYEYGANEYVTVARGISPDGKFAITAHQDYGHNNFHLYLTDAQTGKNIGPLEEIKPILDTCAGSFVAKWSADSSKVTIVWRWSRQDPFLSMTYRIKGRRAIPLTKAPVDSNEMGDLWSKNCSKSQPTPKRFGSPKKHEEDKEDR